MGQVLVVVTTPGGSSSAIPAGTGNNQFLYTGPLITSVSPSAVPFNTPTTINVNGWGFMGGWQASSAPAASSKVTALTVNGVAYTPAQYNVASDNLITLTVPAVGSSSASRPRC